MSHRQNRQVLTGHANGVITINLAEADDAERERRRQQMGELYRTLLGHFRHEIGHYYWDRLIANAPQLEELPPHLRRRAARLCGRSAKLLCQRRAGRLVGAFYFRLCELAPLGGFCRDLGALFSHDRYTRNRARGRPGRQSKAARRPWRRLRFRSARHRHEPPGRGLAGAHASRSIRSIAAWACPISILSCSAPWPWPSSFVHSLSELFAAKYCQRAGAKDGSSARLRPATTTALKAARDTIPMRLCDFPCNANCPDQERALRSQAALAASPKTDKNGLNFNAFAPCNARRMGGEMPSRHNQFGHSVAGREPVRCPG